MPTLTFPSSVPIANAHWSLVPNTQSFESELNRDGQDLALPGDRWALQITVADLMGRALGGPVESGSTYLVGERGPELLIMGSQGGTVTPNSALGGQRQTVRVTNVYQISTGVSDTVRAEIMRAVPAITQHSVAAVYQAINSGGELSRAVGRM